MVTVINDPYRSLGGSIGAALGMGLQQHLNRQYESNRLRGAFDQLKPGTNFLEQLKAIAPELLTSPHGAQALGEISPLLSKFAEQQGYSNYLKDKEKSRTPRGLQQQVQDTLQESRSDAQASPKAQGQASAGPEEQYLRPTPEPSPATLRPGQSAAQTRPVPTPEEVEDRVLNLMQESASVGKPIDPVAARQLVNQEVANTMAYNQQVEADRQRRQEAFDERRADTLQRAEASGLIDEPELRTVAEKLATKYADEASPEKRWQKVRDDLGKINAARSNLKRVYGVAGPLTQLGRLVQGTYKDKQLAAIQAQKSLQIYREEGLYDLARKDLTESIGLGPDDAESWLFPMSDSQKQMLSNIPAKKLPPSALRSKYASMFPSRATAGANEKEYAVLKNHVLKYINANPDANLIAMRGFLNQDRHYAWEDITQAINDLISDGQINLNTQQMRQKGVIDNPPLPGPAQLFKFAWTGTK